MIDSAEAYCSGLEAYSKVLRPVCYALSLHPSHLKHAAAAAAAARFPQASVTSSSAPSASSLQGGVPEVFSTGAFLRVKLEEVPLAATSPPQHPSDEASGGPPAAAGEEEDGGEAEGVAAPVTMEAGGDDVGSTLDPTSAVASDAPAFPPSSFPAPSSQLLIRLVPAREEIVDVAAGLFDDMTEAAGQVWTKGDV